MNMIKYSLQLEMCESERNKIKNVIAGMDWKTQMRSDIPDTDTILRAASILKMDGEEDLKRFILEYILKDLQLSDDQKERLRQT